MNLEALRYRPERDSRGFRLKRTRILSALSQCTPLQSVAAAGVYRQPKQPYRYSRCSNQRAALTRPRPGAGRRRRHIAQTGPRRFELPLVLPMILSCGSPVLILLCVESTVTMAMKDTWLPGEARVLSRKAESSVSFLREDHRLPVQSQDDQKKIGRKTQRRTKCVEQTQGESTFPLLSELSGNQSHTASEVVMSSSPPSGPVSPTEPSVVRTPNMAVIPSPVTPSIDTPLSFPWLPTRGLSSVSVISVAPPPTPVPCPAVRNFTLAGPGSSREEGGLRGGRYSYALKNLPQHPHCDI
ncbi:hypothetical protein DPEC_G00242600 [Dallia pectoralis]|uniref:Uncharacterized protein n=1 Tax=Dallia pectoralis TaxID=75939 RepID=A0ACC2FVI9_DALPE|nr:hypothetical protein DPEC_G00242600 [Dallia pectoralis]